MALSRRTGARFQASIWPGFVDAMTGLLLVLMFVLTIFMVVQFVLRETIKGQGSELEELAAEVAALANALGFEEAASNNLRNEIGNLNSSLRDAQESARQRDALIASLTTERDARTAELANATQQITNFEAQVAALLLQQQDSTARISELEGSQVTLTQSLAAARDEIDAQTEAARLAAAQREALEAEITKLQTDAAEQELSLNQTLAMLQSEKDISAQQLVALQDLEAQASDLQSRLSQEEAVRIAEAAAAQELRRLLENSQGALSEEEQARIAEVATAEALRRKLEESQAELTAMTLQLEEQRQKAEETLSLLAGANAASQGLDEKLAASILALDAARKAKDLTTTELELAKSEGAATSDKLIEALAKLKTREADLTQALANLAQSDETLGSRTATAEKLTADLAAAQAAFAKVQTDLQLATADLDRKTAQIAELERDLANSQGTLGNRDTELARLKVEMAGLRADLAVLREDRDDQSSTVTAVRDQIALVLADLGRAETDRDAAVLNADQLRAEVIALKAELEVARQKATKVDQELAQAQQSATAAQSTLDDERSQLALALASLVAVEGAVKTNQTEQERLQSLLATAQLALDDEKQISTQAQRQVEALNQQVAQLRNELGGLQSLLDASRADDEANQVQLDSLGSELNSALAKLAAEEKRRAESLERFKSEFLAQMRDLLEGRDGVTIVGDRFVFASEVLFPPGGARLSTAGRGEVAKIATLLRDISGDIPASIDWVIQVDGHTDNLPISGEGEFANNWELSQARALSVVLYMVEFLGLPPSRLSANGFGQYQPINAANTPTARAQNRRIELKFTEK